MIPNKLLFIYYDSYKLLSRWSGLNKEYIARALVIILQKINIHFTLYKK